MKFTTDLLTLNSAFDSTASGKADLTLEAPSENIRTLRVQIDADGLEDVSAFGGIHVAHIHGQFEDNASRPLLEQGDGAFFDGDGGEAVNSILPTLGDSDVDGDGFLNFLEGRPNYGPVVLNLTSTQIEAAPDGTPPLTHFLNLAGAGEINPAELFPSGTEFNLDTTYTFDLSDPDQERQFNNLMPLNQREIVLHGLTIPVGTSEAIDDAAMGTAPVGIDLDNGEAFRITAPVAAGTISVDLPDFATNSQFLALTDDNTIVSFDPSNPEETTSIEVTGVKGVLLGIDTRPANGLVYGLTTANDIYTIDPDSGEATYVSTLDVPFDGGTISGFDFNPAADRLRLVGDNDQDFRINVETGEVIVDGMLAFADGDVNDGVNPNVTAAAYTNSFDGTTSTQLYDIDTLLNTLVLQDPPNDGTLVTVGDLGVDFDTLGGFDIISSFDSENAAFAVSDSSLYTIDLATGMAFGLGQIGSEDNLNFQGLATVKNFSTVEEILDNSQFLALSDDNTIVSFDLSNPETTTSIEVTGVKGVLLGIDTRPANGLVYGLTTANNIYTIDPDSGEATYVSTLDLPFEGGTISGFDFNPAADRLRLVGDNDQDFRINVETGEVIVDGMLAFADGDVNDGVNPNVTAAAYTNSFDGTTSTQLYDIDTLLNTLVLQDPPNDGTLVTVGDLGVDFDTLGGFDIVSSIDGENAAFAVSDGTLYRVDLATGEASNLGTLGDSDSMNLQGLTIAFDNNKMDVEFDLPIEEAQTVPEVPDTDAEGSFDAVLEGNMLTIMGEFSDLTSPLLPVGGEDSAGNPESSIHVHIGEVGEGGPILRNLNVIDDGDLSGSFEGTFKLTSEDAALAEADGLYVNLHTENNTSGELRGQVIIEEDDMAVNNDTLIDLSGMDTQSVNFTVSRNAFFDSTIGFYEVANIDGGVVDPMSGETIAVGESGYLEAAIANSADIALTAANGDSAEFGNELAGDAIYAPYIVVNGTVAELEDADSSNDPTVYFTYLGANADGSEHIRSLDANTLGFEDLPNGGDMDFNDLIVEFELV